MQDDASMSCQALNRAILPEFHLTFFNHNSPPPRYTSSPCSKLCRMIVPRGGSVGVPLDCRQPCRHSHTKKHMCVCVVCSFRDFTAQFWRFFYFFSENIYFQFEKIYFESGWIPKISKMLNKNVKFSHYYLSKSKYFRASLKLIISSFTLLRSIYKLWKRGGG